MIEEKRRIELSIIEKPDKQNNTCDKYGKCGLL